MDAPREWFGHLRTMSGMSGAVLAGAEPGQTRHHPEGCPYVRVSGALPAWHSDAEAPANGVRFGRCYRRGL
jgi:hypothetical protein